MYCCRKGIGQPKRAEVFMLRGLRPVLHRADLRVLAHQGAAKQKLARRQSRQAPLTVSVPGRAPGAAMRKILQGRDEEQGLPVRTRNWQFKGRKKEAWRGGAKGSRTASRKRYSRCQYSFYRLRRGALATGWTSAPFRGRKTNTGAFLAF